MNITYVLRLAFLQLTARASGSLISLLLFGIGVAMISFLILAGKQLEEQFTANLAGVDLVAGAKGSPLQLILSSVMHIDYPTGNISLAEARQLSNHPMIKETIPIALGDNHMGFRIVGTTQEYAALYDARLADGVWHDNVMEASIGYQAARLTGLSLGDRFIGVHGFQSAGHTHDDHEYIVTGILARTGRVIDRLILTRVESVWKVHEQEHGDDHDHDQHHDQHHDHEHHSDHDHNHDHGHNHHDDHDHEHHSDHDHNHDHDHEHFEEQSHVPEHSHDHEYERENGHEQDFDNQHDGTTILDDIRKRVEAGEDISAQEMAIFQQAMSATESAPASESSEITALLIKYRGPAGAVHLPRFINESTNMQAASPSLELNRLLSLLGYGFNTLKILAWIIIIISAINVFIQLINSLRQGLFQMALMRVMGAGKHAIFTLLIFQGILIATGGWLLGLILSRLLWMFLPAIQVLQTGAGIRLQPSELSLLAYALIAGIMAALIPALMAYKTDVHFTLTKNGRV